LVKGKKNCDSRIPPALEKIWCRLKRVANLKLITNETQPEALKSKGAAVLFSWVSAARMAAATPSGMGLWRPIQTARQTPGSIS